MKWHDFHKSNFDFHIFVELYRLWKWNQFISNYLHNDEIWHAKNSLRVNFEFRQTRVWLQFTFSMSHAFRLHLFATFDMQNWKCVHCVLNREKKLSSFTFFLNSICDCQICDCELFLFYNFDVHVIKKKWRRQIQQVFHFQMFQRNHLKIERIFSTQ